MTVGQAFRPVINQAGWKACSEGKKKMVLDSNKKCYNNKAPVKKMRLVSPVTERLSEASRRAKTLFRISRPRMRQGFFLTLVTLDYFRHF